MIAKIKEKPYHLFLILIIINLIFAFLNGYIVENRTMDIQLHDSYFVIDYFQVFIVINVFVSLLWILYVVFAKKLWSKILTWIHVISTCFYFLFLFNIIGFYIEPQLKVPRRYYSIYEIEAFAQYSYINDIISFIAIILFLSQFLFLVNIIVGLIKQSRKSS